MAAHKSGVTLERMGSFLAPFKDLHLYVDFFKCYFVTLPVGYNINLPHIIHVSVRSFGGSAVSPVST